MQNVSRRSFVGMAGALALVAGVGSLGVQSAIADEGNGVAQVNAQLIDNDCVLDVTEVPAGPVTFTVTNVSAPAISEFELLYNSRIIGEKENLAPGLDAVSFTKTLDGGAYQIYVPGANTPYIDFTVTGEAAAAPEGSIQDILNQGVSDYADYVTEQIGYQYDSVVELDEAIQAGDLDAAKEAYAKARPYYERAESAVDGFLLPGTTDVEDNTKNLDYLIDMRASSLDETAGWHGFHAIERDLWGNADAIATEQEEADEQAASGEEISEEDQIVVETDVVEAGITDETKAFSTELVENVRILRDDVIPTFADGLRPEDLANGAADLLEEVSTTKITGEEERYSLLDLLDFRANVEGAQQAFACLRDGLLEIDEDLVARIDDEFRAVTDLLDTYRDENELGGFVKYTDELRKSDGPKFTEVILPLHDDIASLAEKVATA